MKKTAIALALCSICSAWTVAVAAEPNPKDAAQPSPVQDAPKIERIHIGPSRVNDQAPAAEKAVAPAKASVAPKEQKLAQTAQRGNEALAKSMYGQGNVTKARNIKAPGVPPAGPRAGVPETVLPGVGVMPGDSPELQSNVIQVSSDRTHIVNVSGTLTNRIATPFQNPTAILLDGVATVDAVGQSLYVAPNGSPDPISLYVTGDGPNDPVVSLTLVPRSMAPQTIVLQLDGASAPSMASDGRVDNAQSDVYTERIVATLRSLALGKVPSGYAEGALPKAVANMGRVAAIPLARYSGPSFDVYRYRVESIVDGVVEMEESAFWTNGVRAVAFYPSGTVSRGKPTQVFVIADKSATGGH